MSKWVAGYVLDRSLARKWLNHQGLPTQGVDDMDLLSDLLNMIWKTFVPAHLKGPVAKGENTLILARHLGEGSRRKPLKESEEDRRVKQLLLEHGGLSDGELVWATLST